jgi:endonuclease/exonuclease/phosphatase family metal-dependent hydrolase
MSEDRLRALSFNIHGALGRDGRRDLLRVARILRDLACDIVALQEVDSRPGHHSAVEQAALLEEWTGLRALTGPTLLQSDRHYGNLLLVKPPLLQFHRIDLSQAGREPRGAIDARLEISTGCLRVIATHLGLSLRERHLQVTQLLECVEQESTPMLLMGDFNEWLPGIGVLARIHRVFSRPRTPATFPVHWPLLALDRIWGRPDGLIESLRTPIHEDITQTSDHLPLMAELRLHA